MDLKKERIRTLGFDKDVFWADPLRMPKLPGDQFQRPLKRCPIFFSLSLPMFFLKPAFKKNRNPLTIP